MKPGWVKGKPRKASPTNPDALPFMHFLFAEQKRQGLTDRELAKRSGWDKTNLTLWRHNRATPSLPALLDVADVLGLELTFTHKELGECAE